MGVAPGSVGLPDLYKAVADRAAVTVYHSSRDDDPLPQWFALVLAGQVVIQVPYEAAPVGGAGGIREGPREDDERLLWRPETSRQVVRVQVGQLPIILRAQTGGVIGGLLSHPRFSLLV